MLIYFTIVAPHFPLMRVRCLWGHEICINLPHPAVAYLQDWGKFLPCVVNRVIKKRRAKKKNIADSLHVTQRRPFPPPPPFGMVMWAGAELQLARQHVARRWRLCCLPHTVANQRVSTCLRGIRKTTVWQCLPSVCVPVYPCHMCACVCVCLCLSVCLPLKACPIWWRLLLLAIRFGCCLNDAISLTLSPFAWGHTRAREGGYRRGVGIFIASARLDLTWVDLTGVELRVGFIASWAR